MVPEGWHMEMLKNIVDGGIKNGYSPNAAEKNTGHWILGLGALGDNGLIASEIKPVEATQKVLNCRLHSGDFLISRSNTPDKVGRSILFKGEIDNCSYPDLIMRFRVNESLVDTGFIEAKLKSFLIRGYFKNCAAGSSRTMVKINKPIVEKTPLLLPPLHEQKKITCILSTWDKAIDTAKNLIENSKAQKKALMQQLLTGKRRLGFKDKWKESTLTELCSVGTGAKDLKDKVDTGEYPFFVRSQNIERINSYSFDGEAILIPGDGRVGEIFHYINEKFDFHQRVYKVSNFTSVEGKYIYYYLKQHFKAQVKKHSVKATVDSLRMPVFTEMKIKFPPIQEQKKIASVLTAADKKIGILQQKLDCLKQEKKALMQQLLTGKRRVKVNS